MLKTSLFHYVDHAFVTENEARISPFDLGLLRGYGVFDYVQIYEGQPLYLMKHLERLRWSAEQVELDLPMNLEAMQNLAYSLIEKNGAINSGMRFIITGGISNKDLLLPIQGSNLTILFHPYSPLPDRYYTQGMRVITSPDMRPMPAVKTTNYMQAIFGMKKAQKRGFDDALYINEKQEVLECTTSNAWFFKEGRWITSDAKDIVKGVTRDILLEIIKEHYPIEFRSLHLDEVESCEEAFLCSSIKDVIPLVQIEEKIIGKGIPGAHSNSLRHLYWEYIEDYLRAERNKRGLLYV